MPSIRQSSPAVRTSSLARTTGATAVVGGTFGVHRADMYVCGLCRALRPVHFRWAEEKAEHLRVTHGAFVWERPDADGGGYSYTVQVPAN